MPSEKTQELLDSLKEITQKPKKKEQIVRPVSNIYGETADGRPIFIDRLYGSITGHDELVNKDGTIYKGKIHRKRRVIKSRQVDGTVNSFYSVCYETADGRWFDNCGMPIEAPKKVEEEEQAETFEVQKVELTAEEKLANEQAFLNNLK
jgi:hypothetical protein